MSGRTRRWLSRRRAIALVTLGLVFAGVVVLKAQAEAKEITLKPRQRLAAALPSAAASSRATASAPSRQGLAVENVVTDGSKSEIEIGLSYRGERVELFGALGELAADAVIVKITSPPETVKLNQKGRVGPFWMSTKQHTVANVPFMYQISASDKIESIGSEDLRRALGIGYHALRQRIEIHTTKGELDPDDPKIIFKGLLQLKREQGLYQINDDKRITIKGGKLFKHHVIFPAAAREADYLVETYLFRKGRLVGKAADVIHVKKVGMGANIVRWANEYPKIYGVCAVILALGAGLGVGLIFKKGGHH